MSESEMLRIIGANVRTARMKAGLTQECLAELVGLHWQTVSNIERGKYPCGALVLFALAQHLAVPTDALFVGLPAIDQKRALRIKKAMARRRKPAEE